MKHTLHIQISRHSSFRLTSLLCDGIWKKKKIGRSANATGTTTMASTGSRKGDLIISTWKHCRKSSGRHRIVHAGKTRQAFSSPCFFHGILLGPKITHCVSTSSPFLPFPISSSFQSVPQFLVGCEHHHRRRRRHVRKG